MLVQPEVDGWIALGGRGEPEELCHGFPWVETHGKWQVVMRWVMLPQNPGTRAWLWLGRETGHNRGGSVGRPATTEPTVPWVETQGKRQVVMRWVMLPQNPGTRRKTQARGDCKLVSANCKGQIWATGRVSRAAVLPRAWQDYFGLDACEREMGGALRGAYAPYMFSIDGGWVEDAVNGREGVFVDPNAGPGNEVERVAKSGLGVVRGAGDLDVVVIERRVELARRSLDVHSGQLDSLSPLAVLARGYSLTTRLDDDRLVRSGNDVSAGDRVRTRLRDAELLCRVEDVVPGSVKSGESVEPTRESSES